jgi:hypothetical protein
MFGMNLILNQQLLSNVWQHIHPGRFISAHTLIHSPSIAAPPAYITRRPNDIKTVSKGALPQLLSTVPAHKPQSE